MKEHSEEVKKFRSMIVPRIRNMDYSKFSREDAMFYYHYAMMSWCT